MTILNIFKRKNTKNFLRIYANAGIANYGESEKQVISDCLISIATKILGEVKLKYDISGSGYGISKGSPRFGVKSYRNRLKKKGYEAMWGMSVGSDEYNYDSRFILAGSTNSTQYIEFSFYWSLEEDIDMNYCLNILRQVSKISEINYAYAYPAKENMMLGEWFIKNKILYSESYKSPGLIKWNKNWADVLEGKIRRLYPLNCFNAKQLENLSEIIPMERTPLENGIECWKISKSEIARGNKILNNLVEVV